MSTKSQLVDKLLSQNIARKQFIDNMRLDIVAGREVSVDDVKCAIEYLRDDAVARGQAQAKRAAPKKAASKKPAQKVDAEAVLKGLF